MIPIETDLFDIADRLKAIDPSYRLYYNTRLSKYQLVQSRKGKEDISSPFLSILLIAGVTHCLKTREKTPKSRLKSWKDKTWRTKRKSLTMRKAFEDKAERYLRKL